MHRQQHTWPPPRLQLLPPLPLLQPLLGHQWAIAQGGSIQSSRRQHAG